jgi:hypothetical protein
MDKRKIARALLSVSDKTGLADFAREWIVSTGGTAKALRETGVPVTDVAEITQSPEMMDGRVKTLHPKIHGGLLAVRGNAAHERALAEHAIPAIDLLAVNLYPFEATVESGADFATCIENIDRRAGPDPAARSRERQVVVEPAIMPCWRRWPRMAARRRRLGARSPESARATIPTTRHLRVVRREARRADTEDACDRRHAGRSAPLRREPASMGGLLPDK